MPQDRRVVAGDDAQPGVAVGEARGLGDDADISEQRHHQPRPHRHPIDRRDHRLVEVDHVVDQVRGLAHGPRHRRGVTRHLLDHLEVAAR
jgi:hypothetical protein